MLSLQADTSHRCSSLCLQTVLCPSPLTLPSWDPTTCMADNLVSPQRSHKSVRSLYILSFSPVFLFAELLLMGSDVRSPVLSPPHLVYNRNHEESCFRVCSFHFWHFHLVLFCAFYLLVISPPLHARRIPLQLHPLTYVS